MHVFIVAENNEDRELCTQALRLAGLQSVAYKDLDKALETAEQKSINLLIYWPHAQATFAEIRKKIAHIRRWLIVPVFLIVEKVSESDHCDFLDEGVDLVFERPVSLRLLMRYAGILMRRTNSISLATLTPVVSEVIALDPGNHTVTVNGQNPEHLTQLEFRLLYVLMVNADQVIPIGDLVELVWGYNGEGNKDLVRGLIRRLRRKIEPAGQRPVFIQNLPGIGYRFSTANPQH